jgi:hypothetical protein
LRFQIIWDARAALRAAWTALEREYPTQRKPARPQTARTFFPVDMTMLRNLGIDERK